MRIKVKQGFKYAYRGVEVTEYAAGDVIEVPEECAELALEQGWAVAEGDTKDAGAAPENKARRVRKA